MRTQLLVLFAAISFAQTNPPASTARKQIGEPNREQHGTQYRPTELPVSLPSSTQPGQAASAPNTPAGKTQPKKTWGEPILNYVRDALVPNNLSNWCLCGFAAIAAIIGLRTLSAIKEQARAARISLRLIKRQIEDNKRAIEAGELAAEASQKSAETAAWSARQAEKALHLTERADVLLEGVSLSTPGVACQTPPFTLETVITLRFKNFGRTRANQVSSHFWLGVPNAQLVEQPSNVVTIVGAGDSFLLAFNPVHECLNKATFEKILAGEVPFRFQGEITYKDVFGFEHRTKCVAILRHQPVSFEVEENSAD